MIHLMSSNYVLYSRYNAPKSIQLLHTLSCLNTTVYASKSVVQNVLSHVHVCCIFTTKWKASFTKQMAFQCVKLTLARSPMATIYCHLVTYFSFPSAILGDKVSGWLGCAAHGMRDITHEPMRPTEELVVSCQEVQCLLSGVIAL